MHNKSIFKAYLNRFQRATRSLWNCIESVLTM